MPPLYPWIHLTFSLYLALPNVTEEKPSCATIYYRQRKHWENLLKTMVLIRSTSSHNNSSKPYSVGITTNNHWSGIQLLITTIHTNSKPKQLLVVTDPKKLIKQNNSEAGKLLTKINFHSFPSNFAVPFFHH